MSALREIAAHFGIEFDKEGLQQGGTAVDGMVEKIKGFATTLGAGFALKEVFEFTVGLTEQADALAKQADAAGMSLAQLQEWNYVAMMAGVSGQQLQGTFQKLVMGAAKNKAIQQFHIDLKKADGTMKTGADLFGELGDSISKIEDPGERAKAAMDAFGKSGLKMLPIFSDGAEGIEALRKEFKEMGGGFDDDFAKRSDEFGDNMDRMKTMARQVGINIVSRLLPAFLKITVWLVKVIKPIVFWLKNSRALEAGLVSLGISGVMFLSGKIGGLGAAMNKLLFKVLPLIAAFLVLEDLWGFLNGDESLIGDIITNFFGAAAAEKVRKWVQGVWTEFKSFFGDIKDRPLKLLDDWDVFTTQLTKDMVNLFGPTIGGILNTAGGMFTSFLDLMTGGWDNFTNKIGAVWTIAVLAMKIPFFELAMFILGLTANIKDTFNSLWNSIVQGAMKAVGLFGKIASAVGASGVAKDIAKFQDGMAGMQGSETNAEDQSASAYRQRTQFAADYDAAQAKLGAGVKGGLGGIGSVQNNVTVNVPAGTPAQQAAAIATAAKTGVQQGTSKAATQAATKPGGA